MFAPFPTDFSGYEGFKGYFYAKRGWFLGAFCLAEIIGLVDIANKGTEYFRGLGAHYWIAVTVAIAFSVTAMITQNEKFHAVFILAAFSFLNWIPRF